MEHLHDESLASRPTTALIDVNALARRGLDDVVMTSKEIPKPVRPDGKAQPRPSHPAQTKTKGSLKEQIEAWARKITPYPGEEG
jgi:hypothetical protein